MWEILLLVERKRLGEIISAEEWLERTLAMGNWKEAPVTHRVAREAGRLRLQQRDPIDRLLAATAIVYGLTLVTADEYLLAAPGLKTLANR